MILRRLGLFPDPQSPPHSLFRRLRRHLPLWEGFLSSSKDERTTATTRLPSLHYAGYSTSVTNPPHMVQYNRVRGSSAKHATDGPKSARRRAGLNRVNCITANTCKLRTSPLRTPVLKADSKGRLGSPLACLSPISFFTQRKMSPPEAVSQQPYLVKTNNT